MIRHRTVVPLVAVLALTACAPAPTPAEAPTAPATADALARLEGASRSTPRVRFHVGFPRTVTGRFATTGTTLEERARGFLAQQEGLYAVRSPDLQLVAVRQLDRDGRGIVFAQTWRGVPVVGAELTVLFSGTDVVGTFGQLLQEPPRIEPQPALGPNAALKLARDAVRFPDGPLRSTPTLRLVDPSLSELGGTPRLVWDLGFVGGAQVTVDAHHGEVEVVSTSAEDFDLQYETANDLASAEADLCYYNTTDDDQIGDEDGIDPGYESLFDYQDLFDEIQGADAYYRTVHHRASYDDADAQLEAYARALVPNAQWTGGCDVAEFKSEYHSPSIVAHELGHAIIGSTAQLDKTDQPDALNESFGDLMGVGHNGSWFHGADRPGATTNEVRDLTKWRTMLQFKPGGDPHKNGMIIGHAHFRMTKDRTFWGGAHQLSTSQTAQLAYATFPALSSSAQFQDVADLSVATMQAWVSEGKTGFEPGDVCVVRQSLYEVGLADPDADCDGVSEWNEYDADMDGIIDVYDNCPNVPNPTQVDSSFPKNFVGDACDPDQDGDGVKNADDDCPLVYDPDQTTLNCFDVDLDGVLDVDDNCPKAYNPGQNDVDHDGTGNACEVDSDGDGVWDEVDLCPFDVDASNADTDRDHVGDVCDICPDDPQDYVTWFEGVPELGIGPEAFFDDADHDGTPDQCDRTPQGDHTRMTLGGIDVTLGTWLGFGEATFEVDLDPGSLAGIAIDPCPDLCDDTRGYDDGLRIGLTGVPKGVGVEVVDETGRVVSRARVDDELGLRVVRFSPRGDRSYRLLFVSGPEAAGPFRASARVESHRFVPDFERSGTTIEVRR